MRHTHVRTFDALFSKVYTSLHAFCWNIFHMLWFYHFIIFYSFFSSLFQFHVLIVAIASNIHFVTALQKNFIITDKRANQINSTITSNIYNNFDRRLIIHVIYQVQNLNICRFHSLQCETERLFRFWIMNWTKEFQGVTWAHCIFQTSCILYTKQVKTIVIMSIMSKSHNLDPEKDCMLFIFLVSVCKD